MAKYLVRFWYDCWLDVVVDAEDEYQAQVEATKVERKSKLNDLIIDYTETEVQELEDD